MAISVSTPRSWIIYEKKQTETKNFALDQNKGDDCSDQL